MGDSIIRAEDFYRLKLLALVDCNTEWLDLGCGHGILKSWLPGADRDQWRLSKSCKRLVGIDAVEQDVMSNPYLHERVVGNLHHLPFDNGEFNLLTAQMVVEHVEHPVRFLAECFRVLRPGGRLVVITPNYLHYQFLLASAIPEWPKKKMVTWLEGREERDIFKTCYRLNTPSRIRRCATEAGFGIESLDMVECWPSFDKIPPLAAIEKTFIRILRWPRLQAFRADIVCSLVKGPSARANQDMIGMSRASSKAAATGDRTSR